MQSPPTTPRCDSPMLGIELSQPENHFYHPGSNVSGHVSYGHFQETGPFELILVFYGVNKSFISSSEEKPCQEASLFRYEIPLHKGVAPRNHSGTQHATPMHFYFKQRFPSLSETRSFSQPYHTIEDQIWKTSRHPLPPTFEVAVPADRLGNGVKLCSVEYALEVHLFHDKTVTATKRLPLVFLPSRPPSDPRRGIAPSVCWGTVDEAESSIHKRDSCVDFLEDYTHGLRVETPEEIIQGQPFILNILAAYDPSNPCEDLVSKLTNMDITRLSIVCTTSVRASCGQKGYNLSPATQWEHRFYSKKRQIRAVPVGYRLSAKVERSPEMQFSFQATMPSYYSPTFESYLIANSYRFESSIEVLIDGTAIKLPLTAPEVAVLSCHVQANGKRPSVMNVGRNSSFCD